MKSARWSDFVSGEFRLRDNNYQIVKHELLDGLLAGKSTAALSRRMGFSFDQVRRWKNGTKHLRWNEFCDLCETLKAPLGDTSRDLFGLNITNKKDLLRIAESLKIFSRVKSTSQLAKEHGVSLSVIKRYLSGSTSPDVEFVLELIDRRKGFLQKFIDGMKDRTSAPNAKSIFSFPWFSAVSSAMALPEHQRLAEHSTPRIAKFLGLSENQVEDVITLMVSLGMIEKKGTHYAPTLARTLAVGSRINEDEFVSASRFWTKRALDSQAERNEINRTYFRSFATDPVSAEKVTRILGRAEQEIHDVLTSGQGERSELRVMVLHHFPANVVSWDEAAP